MKRTITVLTAACLCFASYAAIVIRGTIAPDLGNKVSLYAINDGLDSLCATAQIAGGKFVLKSAVPYNGLYVLSTDKDNKQKHAIYLKDGAQLAVNYGSNLVVLPTNANAHEKDFALWATKSAPVFYHAYLYNHTPGGKTVKPQQFLKEMEVLKQTAAALKRKANGKADKNSLLQLKIDADLAFYMLSYRKNNPDAVDDNFISPAALQDYKQLFSDKNVLRLPYAPEMLALYVDYLAEKQNIGKEDYRQRLSLLSSEPLREAYLYQVAQGLNYDEKYTALLRAWGDTPLSSRLQQALKPIEEALAWSKVGQTAIDFRGIRPDSTTLSLSDLRGKVVVIDVWATWCAPCIRMMPYFKQLEKELSHPDLAFMSVCLGVWAESDRWEKLIQEHGLTGNLIFIDSWTKGFAVDYHVTGVPRFMLIDREGRVLSFAAPAPNKPELKAMILEALNAKQ